MFDSEYYVAGIVVLIGSVVLQSNVYILLRMLKEVHSSVTLFVFGVIGTLESAGKHFEIVLQTINRRSCTITEKAPTLAFSWLKALTHGK